jgi:hypothetical protein
MLACWDLAPASWPLPSPAQGPSATILHGPLGDGAFNSQNPILMADMQSTVEATRHTHQIGNVSTKLGAAPLHLVEQRHHLPVDVEPCRLASKIFLAHCFQLGGG